MNLSRFVTGAILIALGIVILVISFYSSFVFLIYSLPLLVLGIIILLNEKEDKIERRKDIKVKVSRR